MENASKALIIAGGVLTAILVISLLVFSRQKLQDYGNAKEQSAILEQTEDFNSTYDAYNRDDVYGSELLSLVNLVEDYNKTYAKDDGYSELSLDVTFTNTVSAYGGEIIVQKKKYSGTELKNIVDSLQSKISGYEKASSGANGKSIASLSGYRSNELDLFLKGKSSSDIQNIKQKISKYQGYKTALTYIKGRTFKATKYLYMPNTARVSKMSFKEND